MTTQTHAEFLAQHAPDGVLTPQQADDLLDLAQGDTGTTLPETGGAPAVPAGNAVNTASTQNVDPDPANAVILAKDGKHTIPYEKLAEAREAERTWRTAAENAQTELAALKAQADARADAGQAPTKTDADVATATAAIELGVDPEIFGDFSEAAIAKGIRELTLSMVAQAAAEIRSELSSVVAPIQKDKEKAATDAHYAAIYAKHPDADSIAESAELDNWIKAQPSFVRSGYLETLKSGSTLEIIELFDAFKGAGRAPQADINARARAQIERAGNVVPTSLSEIPGGRVGATSRFEMVASMSPIEMAEAMQEMTESQRQEFLNRGF